MQAKHSQNYQSPVFQCQYCSYQTKYKQALLNHENCKHTKQREFRCALCPYRTFSNTSLFFHKRKVHGYVPGDKGWQENYASKELEVTSTEVLLSYNLAMTLHAEPSPSLPRRHDKTKALVSEVQEEDGPQETFIMSLFGKQFCCPLCSKPFRSKRAVKIHQLEGHVEAHPTRLLERTKRMADSEGGDQQTNGQIICKEVGQERALKTHKKRGCLKLGEFRCTLCPFTSKVRCLRQHVRIKHEGEKPHKCPYCEFSTTRRYRLDAHQSLHTGVGRIACPTCGQTFGTNSKLRIHRLRVHEKKPTHFCPLCDYSGYIQNDITRHVNSCHQGELNFACAHCQARFSSETALKQHALRQHEEKVSYACPRCAFVCHSEATLKCLGTQELERATSVPLADKALQGHVFCSHDVKNRTSCSLPKAVCRGKQLAWSRFDRDFFHHNWIYESRHGDL
uniref:Zinc finger protein 142 n=1 Tax=Podarcis muralis TaxID=64176 RepID=A0A670K467_PODMU